MRILVFLFFLSTCVFASPPKAIIFDHGKVIANLDRSPMVLFLSQSLDIPKGKIKKDFSSDKLYQALEKPKTFWEKYAKKSLSSAWQEEFEKIKSLLLQPIPGMRDLVLALKQGKYIVGMLSNTTTYRSRFIRKLGGYKLFHPVLLSCDLGVKKPNPKIYKILLQTLNLPPEKCLFIDNKAKNVKAAEKLGIDGIIFKSTDQLKIELKKRHINPNFSG